MLQRGIVSAFMFLRLLGIGCPATLPYFLSLKTLRKKMARMNKMKKMSYCAALPLRWFLRDLCHLGKGEDFSVYECFYSDANYLTAGFCLIFLLFCARSHVTTFFVFQRFLEASSLYQLPLSLCWTQEGWASNSILRMDSLPLSIFCSISIVTDEWNTSEYQYDKYF